MAFGMRGHSVNPIAIEFGVGSLKAMQTSPGDPPALLAASCIETPEELRRDHAARLAFQCEQVGSLLKGVGFKGKQAVCSIPAVHTLVQHMQTHKHNGQSLSEQVMGQLRTRLQCDPSGVVVRHMEVGEVNRGGGAQTEVICIAAARDIVLKQIAALRARRIEVVGAHCEHVAIVRAFDPIHQRPEDRERTTLYLDVGAGTTKAVIAHGRDIVFAKTIQVAGSNLDAAVARQTGCNLAEARARRLTMSSMMPAPVKRTSPEPVAVHAEQGVAGGGPMVAAERRRGAPMPGLTQTIETDETESPAQPDLSSPLESLAHEVSMCARYHRRLFADRPIERVIFVGGEARHLALCQQLARMLRLPAQIADPLSLLRRRGDEPSRGVDLTEPQPGWTVALGLGLCPRDL